MKVFLGILLGIALFVCNIFICIGELFEYAEMGTPWMMVRWAVVLSDIVSVVMLIRLWVKQNHLKKEMVTQYKQNDIIRKSAEKQRRAEAMEKKAEALRKQEEERRKQEEYERREKEAEHKIAEILNQYSLKSFVFPEPKKLWNGKHFECNSSLVNMQILESVHSYADGLQKIRREAENLKTNSFEILKKTDFTSSCERLRFLNLNLEALSQMLDRVKKLHMEYADKKIELGDQNKIIMNQLSNGVSLIRASQKFVSYDIKRGGMLRSDLPEGISMFRYSDRPAVLYVHDFYFCLFSTVILVFDQSGLFSTSLKPSALSVRSRRESEIVFFTKKGTWGHESFSTEDQYVGKDSELIMEGKEEHTWLHTCKNGSPDRRYSHNPMFINRTDTWEFGRITVTIAKFKVTFCVSSIECADAWAKISNYFTKQ